MQAIQALFQLRWSQEPRLHPLPAHIRRTFVSSKKGDLELLSCEPKSSVPSTAPALFFVHGGYGSAPVWLEWMTYLYEHDYPGRTFAYSARNHGASYAVPYFEMVFNTPLKEIAGDLTACAHYAEEKMNGKDSLILVGHSAGGGLTQYALANGLIRARALCLVDAVPHFGMADLYWQWFLHDPWFPLRSLLHLGHPTSPLSTPDLVYGAFFGHCFDRSAVPAFIQQFMPSYESMGWPIGQFGSLFQWLRGRNTWLKVESILRHLEVSRIKQDSLLVMVGTEDMMYVPAMYNRLAEEYRDGICQLEQGKKIDSVHGGSAELRTDIDGASIVSWGGVRVVQIEHAGHHVQNDVQSATAAETLRLWAKEA